MNKIPYFFPFFFIGMWTLVTYVISKMGWTNLVDKYLFQDQFIGQRIGIISASINNSNYKNSLILKYNQDGIYLRPVILFRLFHKPILIPWTEIKEVRTKKILFTTLKELIVGHPFVAIITLKESTFRQIENQLDSSILEKKF
jgi:hypothetical protein